MFSVIRLCGSLGHNLLEIDLFQLKVCNLKSQTFPKSLIFSTYFLQGWSEGRVYQFSYYQFMSSFYRHYVSQRDASPASKRLAFVAVKCQRWFPLSKPLRFAALLPPDGRRAPRTKNHPLQRFRGSVGRWDVRSNGWQALDASHRSR